jgi:hypothetical protein
LICPTFQEFDVHRLSSSFVLSVFASIMLLTLVGCQAKSPEEQVAEKRAKHSVDLNGWYPKVENAAMDAAMDAEATGDMAADDMAGEAGGDMAGADMAGDDMAGHDMTGDEMAGEEMMTGPQPHTIVFDLLVHYDGRGDSLPGITVDVTQAGADGQEKGSWLQFLDTPGIAKGSSKQIAFEIPGVLFEEGDVFAVTLNQNVAAADRSKYREFSTAGY